MPRNPTGRMAFTRGLFFGLLLTLVVTAWILAVSHPSPLRNALDTDPSLDPFGLSHLLVSLLISLIQGLVAWIVFYFAGRAGARAGGKVSTGMVTCLWASLWYLLADLIGFALIAVISAGGLPHLGDALSSLPDVSRRFPSTLPWLSSVWALGPWARAGEHHVSERRTRHSDQRSVSFPVPQAVPGSNHVSACQ